MTQDEEHEERRQAELDFVEAAYDPNEAWCVRGDIPQIYYRIMQRDWTLCISMPRGYPESELVEIGFHESQAGDRTNSPLQQQLLDVCREAAAALPGEEAVFAVMNAAADWSQQQRKEDEETLENAVGLISSSSSSSCVKLQKIPFHQLSPRQAWASKKWDFYKLVRFPNALTALVAHMPPGAHVCGFDDRSLFLKGNTNYEPDRRSGLQSVFTSKLVFRLIWLENETRHEENIEVWGACHEAVAETASWLFSLPDQQRHILSMLAYSNSTFSFEFLFSGILSALLSPNPWRQVRFGGIDFSKEHCAILATQEHEVNIVLAHCWLAGDAFLDCLQQRKTSFGSLTLHSVHPFRDDMFASFLVHSSQIVSKLYLVNLVLRDAWLPFRARARHVELVNCAVEEDDDDDSLEGPFVVLPKAFVLGFDSTRNAVHYHRFLDASHGLNKLGVQFSSKPTGEQMQTLFRAMENNRQLKVLELGQTIVYLKEYWNELTAVLQNSLTIVKLRLHTRNSRPDAEMLTRLKQLLKDRRDMQVIFPTDDWPLTPTSASEWEMELRPTLAFNRWYLGVMKLQSLESIVRRDALFGRALLQSSDFRFVSFLLASNLDVLFSLMEN